MQFSPTPPRRRAQVRAFDRELDADRNFFQRFPHRRYRIRRIFRNERMEFERAGPLQPQPPGFSTCVAVEEVFRGARLRVPFAAQIVVDTNELCEARCKQVFRACLPDQLVELREHMLAVAPRERLRHD